MEHELLDREVLKSSMITRTLVDMHEQVLWHQKRNTADPLEIRRVNRAILEALFPDAIVPVAKRHLDVTAARLHAKQLSAVCLSGGGIRSATFGLGVLQTLPMPDRCVAASLLIDAPGNRSGGLAGDEKPSEFGRKSPAIEEKTLTTEGQSLAIQG